MADYIDREKVTELIDYYQEEYFEAEAYYGLLKEDFLQLPSDDVAPVVHGRWELAEDGWYCTACELYPPFDCDPEEKGIPYCPNCGAKMDLLN